MPRPGTAVTCDPCTYELVLSSMQVREQLFLRREATRLRSWADVAGMASTRERHTTSGKAGVLPQGQDLRRSEASLKVLYIYIYMYMYTCVILAGNVR